MIMNPEHKKFIEGQLESILAPPEEEEEEELRAIDEDGDSLSKGEEPVVDQENGEVAEPAIIEEPVAEEVKPITGF